MSNFVIENFPENYEQYDYLEPYLGAGSVFLNKKTIEGKTQIINDIHPRLITIFIALKDEPKEFIQRIKRITYSERVFNKALKQTNFSDYMEEAINEFVLRRMSRDGLKKAFSWSDRKRGGKPGDVNAWETIFDILPTISQKLKGVTILNKSAIKVIQAFDAPNVLCYADPPYVQSARVTKNAYEYEMSIDDHEAMLIQLKRFNGKVIISGYHSDLYSTMLKDWRCVSKKVPNHSSQQKKKKLNTELLWMNY